MWSLRLGLAVSGQIWKWEAISTAAGVGVREVAPFIWTAKPDL
jgi:hypothetical protein